MATEHAIHDLHLSEAEIAEVQDALESLSPEVREKFLGNMAVVNAIVNTVEIDAGSIDRNREILATRRFLAQADRRGYIHQDDRYNPLREKAIEQFMYRYRLGEEEAAPTAQSLLFGLSELTYQLTHR